MKYTVKILLLCSIILIAQCNSVPPVSDEVKNYNPENDIFKGCTFHCISGDCENGKGTAIFKGKCIYAKKFTKSKFVGFFKNGKPDGRGTSYFLGNKIYEGEFKNGLLHGDIKIGGKNILFEGPYRYGVRHGYGTQYIYGNYGETLLKKYRGLWLNGKAEGEHFSDTFWKNKTYINKFIYINHKANGPVIFHYEDSDDHRLYKYVGNFKDDSAHGKAKVYQYNDDTNQFYLHFEGNYENGKENGYGTRYSLSYRGNERIPVKLYEGEYKNGKRHGRGKLYDHDKNGLKLVYEGEYKNGRRHGNGIYYSSLKGRQHKFVGVFIDGAMTSGTFYDQDGNKTFEGSVKYGKCYKGTSYRLGRKFFKGLFNELNDAHNGVLFDENGEISYNGEVRICGLWYNPSKCCGHNHGRGTSYYKGKKRFSGLWRGGLPYRGSYYNDNGQRVRLRGKFLTVDFFNACYYETNKDYFYMKRGEKLSRREYICENIFLYNTILSAVFSKYKFKNFDIGENFRSVCPKALRKYR